MSNTGENPTEKKNSDKLGDKLAAGTDVLFDPRAEAEAGPGVQEVLAEEKKRTFSIGAWEPSVICCDSSAAAGFYF